PIFRMAFPTLILQYMACLLYLTVPLDTEYPSWSVPVGSIIVIACVYTISCTNTLSCIKTISCTNTLSCIKTISCTNTLSCTNSLYLVPPLDTRSASVVVSLVGCGGEKNRYSLKEQRSKEREFNFYICVSFVTPILVNAVLILYSTPQRRVDLYYITFLFIIIL